MSELSPLTHEPDLTNLVDPLERMYLGAIGLQAWNALFEYTDRSDNRVTFQSFETGQLSAMQQIIRNTVGVTARDGINAFFMHFSSDISRSDVYDRSHRTIQLAGKILGPQWCLRSVQLAANLKLHGHSVRRAEDITRAIYGVGAVG